MLLRTYYLNKQQWEEMLYTGRNLEQDPAHMGQRSRGERGEEQTHHTCNIYLNLKSREAWFLSRWVGADN